MTMTLIFQKLTIDASPQTINSSPTDRTKNSKGASYPTFGKIINHISPMSKIVLIFRNPVDRLISHFFFNARNSKDSQNTQLMVQKFEQWARSRLVAVKSCLSRHKTMRVCAYLTKQGNDLQNGLYSVFLSELYESVPRTQVSTQVLSSHTVLEKNKRRCVHYVPVLANGTYMLLICTLL